MWQLPACQYVPGYQIILVFKISNNKHQWTRVHATLNLYNQCGLFLCQRSCFNYSTHVKPSHSKHQSQLCLSSMKSCCVVARYFRRCATPTDEATQSRQKRILRKITNDFMVYSLYAKTNEQSNITFSRKVFATLRNLQ